MTLGKLEQRRILQHLADGAVLGRGRALAPGGEALGHGSRLRVELADPRQPFPCGLGVALVGGGLEAPTLLDRPIDASGLAQAALDLVGELQQVGDVLGGVAELLGGQRARVPARVARGLADAQAEYGADQVAVAGLGALADEARGDLRVEYVRQLRGPRSAQDRHVLTAGVQDDLDLRIGQQLRQRPHVDVLVEAVDQDRADSGRLARVLDGDLGEAEQRAVTPFGHELGVDPEASVGLRQGDRGGDVSGVCESLHGGTIPALSWAFGTRLPATLWNTYLHGRI